MVVLVSEELVQREAGSYTRYTLFDENGDYTVFLLSQLISSLIKANEIELAKMLAEKKHADIFVGREMPEKK